MSDQSDDFNNLEFGQSNSNSQSSAAKSHPSASNNDTGNEDQSSSRKSDAINASVEHASGSQSNHQTDKCIQQQQSNISLNGSLCRVSQFAISQVNPSNEGNQTGQKERRQSENDEFNVQLRYVDIDPSMIQKTQQFKVKRVKFSQLGISNQDYDHDGITFAYHHLNFNTNDDDVKHSQESNKHVVNVEQEQKIYDLQNQFFHISDRKNAEKTSLLKSRRNEKIAWKDNQKLINRVQPQLDENNYCTNFALLKSKEQQELIDTCLTDDHLKKVIQEPTQDQQTRPFIKSIAERYMNIVKSKLKPTTNSPSDLLTLQEREQKCYQLLVNHKTHVQFPEDLNSFDDEVQEKLSTVINKSIANCLIQLPPQSSGIREALLNKTPLNQSQGENLVSTLYGNILTKGIDTYTIQALKLYYESLVDLDSQKNADDCFYQLQKLFENKEFNDLANQNIDVISSKEWANEVKVAFVQVRQLMKFYLKTVTLRSVKQLMSKDWESVEGQTGNFDKAFWKREGLQLQSKLQLMQDEGLKGVTNEKESCLKKTDLFCLVTLENSPEIVVLYYENVEGGKIHSTNHRKMKSINEIKDTNPWFQHLIQGLFMTYSTFYKVKSPKIAALHFIRYGSDIDQPSSVFNVAMKNLCNQLKSAFPTLVSSKLKVTSYGHKYLSLANHTNLTIFIGANTVYRRAKIYLLDSVVKKGFAIPIDYEPIYFKEHFETYKLVYFNYLDYLQSQIDKKVLISKASIVVARLFFSNKTYSATNYATLDQFLRVVRDASNANQQKKSTTLKSQDLNHKLLQNFPTFQQRLEDVCQTSNSFIVQMIANYWFKNKKAYPVQQNYELLPLMMAVFYQNKASESEGKYTKKTDKSGKEEQKSKSRESVQTNLDFTFKTKPGQQKQSSKIVSPKKKQSPAISMQKNQSNLIERLNTFYQSFKEEKDLRRKQLRLLSICQSIYDIPEELLIQFDKVFKQNVNPIQIVASVEIPNSLDIESYQVWRSYKIIEVCLRSLIDNIRSLQIPSNFSLHELRLNKSSQSDKLQINYFDSSPYFFGCDEQETLYQKPTYFDQELPISEHLLFFNTSIDSAMKHYIQDPDYPNSTNLEQLYATMYVQKQTLSKKALDKLISDLQSQNQQSLLISSKTKISKLTLSNFINTMLLQVKNDVVNPMRCQKFIEKKFQNFVYLFKGTMEPLNCELNELYKNLSIQYILFHQNKQTDAQFSYRSLENVEKYMQSNCFTLDQFIGIDLVNLTKKKTLLSFAFPSFWTKDTNLIVSDTNDFFLNNFTDETTFVETIIKAYLLNLNKKDVVTRSSAKESSPEINQRFIVDIQLYDTHERTRDNDDFFKNLENDSFAIKIESGKDKSSKIWYHFFNQEKSRHEKMSFFTYLKQKFGIDKEDNWFAQLSFYENFANQPSSTSSISQKFKLRGQSKSNYRYENAKSVQDSKPVVQTFKFSPRHFTKEDLIQAIDYPPSIDQIEQKVSQHKPLITSIEDLFGQ